MRAVDGSSMPSGSSPGPGGAGGCAKRTASWSGSAGRPPHPIPRSRAERLRLGARWLEDELAAGMPRQQGL